MLSVPIMAIAVPTGTTMIYTVVLNLISSTLLYMKTYSPTFAVGLATLTNLG